MPMNMKPPSFRGNIRLVEMVTHEEEHIRRDPGAHLAKGRFAIFWIVGDYGPLNRHDVPRLIHCFKGSIQQGLHESNPSGVATWTQNTRRCSWFTSSVWVYVESIAACNVFSGGGRWRSEYSIQEFIQDLRSLSGRPSPWTAYISFSRVTRSILAALKKYLFFRKSHYTRNLIDKCDHYELLSICWEAGQTSQIHNHRGQNCWMAVPLGKLLVQNYRVVEGQDGTEHCELAESSRYWMDPLNPGRVEPEEPIHSVANPGELNQRAVSIHIYSYPYDACTVYFLEHKRSLEVPLHYSSRYGVLEPEEQQD